MTIARAAPAFGGRPGPGTPGDATARVESNAGVYRRAQPLPFADRFGVSVTTKDG